MEYLLSITLLVIGFGIGLQLRDIRDRLKVLESPKNKPAEPAIVMGSYDKTDTANHTNTPSPYGIAEVKTPQLLDWEERERIKKGIENV